MKVAERPPTASSGRSMKYRMPGRTGSQVSPYCLGTQGPPRRSRAQIAPLGTHADLNDVACARQAVSSLSLRRPARS